MTPRRRHVTLARWTRTNLVPARSVRMRTSRYARLRFRARASLSSSVRNATQWDPSPSPAKRPTTRCIAGTSALAITSTLCQPRAKLPPGTEPRSALTCAPIIRQTSGFEDLVPSATGEPGRKRNRSSLRPTRIRSRIRVPRPPYTVRRRIAQSCRLTALHRARVTTMRARPRLLRTGSVACALASRPSRSMGD